MIDLDFSEVKEFKPIPKGTYLGNVTGFKILPAKSEDKSGGVQWSVVITDVVEMAPGQDSESNVVGREHKHSVWGANYYSMKFYSALLGIEKIEGNLREYIQSWDELVGRPVQFTIEHKPSDSDPSKVYANLISPCPA